MTFRVGIENNNDGRSIAWALEHPGCFAYGPDQAGAEALFPDAARSYAAWVTGNGGDWPPARAGMSCATEETFDVYYVDSSFERVGQAHGSMVESFFGYDWKPLGPLDVDRAMHILAWCRADLLGMVSGLTSEQLSRSHPGERWDINGILKHIAGGEWWYQERIGFPFPEREQDLPLDPLTSLELVRDHFRTLLPKLAGLDRVVGREGELWSPRKVLRRLVWHERDHTEHIRKLL
jgi:DinB family protein